MNQVFMSWGLVINAAAPKRREVRHGASGSPGSRCQASDIRVKSVSFGYIFIFFRMDVADWASVTLISFA